MKKLLLILSVVLIGCRGNAQQSMSQSAVNRVEFHNESTDTTRINQLLIDVIASNPQTPGDAVIAFASRFIDTPYKGKTLEGEEEVLRINLDQVDCTTFVEMMMALAITIDHRRSSWRDFTYYLRNLRYRGGEINGYPSRLHYIADWAVDNIHRGNFIEATTLFPRYSYMVKSIDFMTANADKYAALADSTNLAGIENTEIGYRSHRFPYIKTVDLASKDVKKQFQDGDILAFTSNIKNLDVTHMGILILKDGEPHVLHASSSAGKVLVSDRPIAEFVKKNKGFTGVRVFRINKQY